MDNLINELSGNVQKTEGSGAGGGITEIPEPLQVDSLEVAEDADIQGNLEITGNNTVGNKLYTDQIVRKSGNENNRIRLLNNNLVRFDRRVLIHNTEESDLWGPINTRSTNARGHVDHAPFSSVNDGSNLLYISARDDNSPALVFSQIGQTNYYSIGCEPPPDTNRLYFYHGEPSNNSKRMDITGGGDLSVHSSITVPDLTVEDTANIKALETENAHITDILKCEELLVKPKQDDVDLPDSYPYFSFSDPEDLTKHFQEIIIIRDLFQVILHKQEML